MGRYWVAEWDDLAYSDADGRVDWFCGEATRESLEKVHEALLEREHGAAKQRKRQEFQKLLRH